MRAKKKKKYIYIYIYVYFIDSLWLKYYFIISLTPCLSLSLSQSLHLKLSSSPKTLSSSHPLSVTLSSSLIHCRRPDPIVPSCQSPQTQAANHLSVSSVVVVVVWVDRRRCVRRHQWAVVGFVSISGWLGWVSWWWVWVLCLLVGGWSECLVIWVFFFFLACCGMVVVAVVVGVGVVLAHGWSIGVLGDLVFYFIFFYLLWIGGGGVGGGCGYDWC